MLEKLGVYTCSICGNTVEVLIAAEGALSCCGQAMAYEEEKTADSSTEKHVPFIEKIEGGYKVKVGENAAHPMLDNHYIQWIEIITKTGKIYRQELKPGDAPEAVFLLEDEVVVAREYCNLHGHWKGTL